MLVRQPGGTAVATTRLEPAGQGVRADARLGRLVLAVAATATVLIVYAVHASLPANSVQLPFENQLAIREFVPEGWAFFTKSPLTVYPVPYVHGAGGWRSATAGALAVPTDAMGLDRIRRAQGTEIALLIQSIPAWRWRSCVSVPVTCLTRTPVADVVQNTSTHRSLCGDVGFVEQQVLPWAWRGTGTVMPSRVLRLLVSC